MLARSVGLRTECIGRIHIAATLGDWQRLGTWRSRARREKRVDRTEMVVGITGKLIRSVILTLLLVTGFATGRAETLVHHSTSPERQLWLVDTRGAPSQGASIQQASRLRYWRFCTDRRWCSANLPELLSTDDPASTTLFYVHGNRVSRGESFRRACAVFANLSRRVPAGQSFRLIAVSWPSDRIGVRPRPDAQIKARRSESHGLYLAWLTDQIHPDVSIGMFGMSYGPRLITAALHYLGGGSIDGRCLHARINPIRKPIRVALAAAALNAHWLQPGQRHGQALTQVEQALILINPRDRVLKWYPRMYGLGRRGSQALGYVGMRFRRSGLTDPNRVDSARVIQWNVSGQIASAHRWTAYEGSPSMMRKW